MSRTHKSYQNPLLRIVVGISIACSACCAQTYVLRPVLIDRNLAVAVSQIMVTTPKGWQIHNSNFSYAISFRPVECESDCPLLRAEVYHLNSRQPRSEAGQASQYLDGVHRHDDESVIMEPVSSLYIGRKNELKVYRFHSKWFGEHLVVFLVKEDLMDIAELTGNNFVELYNRLTGLQELAATVWSSMKGHS